MTKQEIFDRVARHLLAQGKRAVAMMDDGEEQCRYRGEGGTKCAVGCLIADEAYSSAIEGKTAGTILVRDALRDSGVDMSDESTVDMLRALQEVHDDHTVSAWPESLREVALDYDLSAEVLNA